MNINVHFSKRSTPSKCKQSCLSCIPCNKAKTTKKPTRSLATFDKLNYFPVQFVESIVFNKESEQESKLNERVVSLSQDKSKVIQKIIKSNNHNIAQAIDEEDPNQQQEEQGEEQENGASEDNSLAADLPVHLRHSLAGIQHGRHQSQSREMYLESMIN